MLRLPTVQEVMVRKVTAGAPLRATLTYIGPADGGWSPGLSFHFEYILRHRDAESEGRFLLVVFNPMYREAKASWVCGA